MNQQMEGATKSTALGATTYTLSTIGKQIPSTFTLKSSDATRKIEFSTDGGVEYFQPTYDVTSATMLVVTTNSGISHVKFTGLSADTWSVA